MKENDPSSSASSKSNSPLTSPLTRFSEIRAQILKQVVNKTLSEFSEDQIENELVTTLYLEKQRLARSKGNFFTKKRLKADRKLWSQIQVGLLKPAHEVSRKELLEQVCKHYAEEVGGHFHSSVYKFATYALPLFFSYLLNAASLRRILPWRMVRDVDEKLQITGEVEHLKKLAQEGTILLVPTHQSNIDSVLIGYLIYRIGLPPFAYGAGLNLFLNPILNFFLSNLGAYTVDRQKNNPIYKTLLKNYSTEILQAGVHSIFFPGGGRARSGAIESKLKLGLLGTALDAQILNFQQNKPNPKVFVVPMVMSFNFVLEASSLIDDYLAEAGKHRFIITDDDSSKLFKVMNFFWQLFKSESQMVVRVGKPLDVFGNFVDEKGNSITSSHLPIEAREWLKTEGEVKPIAQRDHEYTRILGQKLVERFHAEHTVLSSQLVAFSFFEGLRKKYPDLDLYRFIRLSHEQRRLTEDELISECKEMLRRAMEAAIKGHFHLESGLLGAQADAGLWIHEGLEKLGIFHGNAVIKKEENVYYTEDMNLLYYYRNRLAGFGLSLLADERIPGVFDEKGFLA